MHGLPATPELARDVLELARRRLARIDAADAARLVDALLGDAIEVGDASRYLVHYARSQGYDIPSYAYAGCGEIKQFLRDQGVPDVPGWYVKLGVPADEAPRLYGRTLIAVRDASYRRMALVLAGGYHEADRPFATLGESGLIERLGGEPRIGARRPDARPGESLGEICGRVLDFVLRGETRGLPTY